MCHIKIISLRKHGLNNADYNARTFMFAMEINSVHGNIFGNNLFIFPMIYWACHKYEYYFKEQVCFNDIIILLKFKKYVIEAYLFEGDIIQ